MIRVLLVAASPAMRAGLRSLLASDSRMNVIGESARLNDIEDIEAELELIHTFGNAPVHLPPADSMATSAFW